MKGLFIPGITAEMFRNGCLESIEALMAEGEIYDIEYSPWIPVSKRLPETDTLILVTIQVGSREPKVRSGYYCKGGHFHIDNGDSWEARDKELIAWMPLLEPYKAESEGK